MRLYNQGSIVSLIVETVIITSLHSIVSASSHGGPEGHIAITNFQDYLKINTAHPDPDYNSAIAWIKKQAKNLSLDYNILRYSEKNEEFAVWLTWRGKKPGLESVMLYSHIDVVSVDSNWNHDPFKAEISENGDIYGRGAQDMKSMAVQYLEAIRRLKAKRYNPDRTVHIGFFPDEEVGGTGIRRFVKTSEFKALNVGFALDEGMPTDKPNEVTAFYANRPCLWAKFTAFGQSGHGSLLINDTAAEKLVKVINKLLNFRETEKLRLEGNSSLSLGDVASINLMFLEGGILPNIIPPQLSATFDIRFPIHKTITEMEGFLNDTCIEAGMNVTYEILRKSNTDENNTYHVTEIDREAWWWRGFSSAIASMNLTLSTKVFPAGTDGQVMRSLGIPTIGFSPIFNTTVRMHDRNEYISIQTFLKGIEIYEKVLRELTVDPSKQSANKKPSTGGHGHSSATINAYQYQYRGFSWIVIFSMQFYAVLFFL